MAKKRITIYIEETYYKKIKQMAVKTDSKISLIINRIFKNFLKNKRG